eukprot:Rmarinus@m.11458
MTTKLLQKRCFQKNAFDYYVGGAEDEVTLKENRQAFMDRFRFNPKVLVDVSSPYMSTSVAGIDLRFPVLVAPTAMQRMAHEGGEISMAKATKEAGTVYCLSTLSTTKMEDVQTAVPASPKFYQLYVMKDRALTLDLVRRAEKCGYRALLVTVDAPRLGRRWADMRNGFSLPAGLRLENLNASVKGRRESGESGLASHFQQQIDDSLTWADIDWLRENTDLPIFVKGVSRGSDAELAIGHGCAGVVVSNHGGRQLDTALATLDCLAEVVASVDGRVEVLVDGGIRRGSDVLKALALGARAVLIGRPMLWGLASDGQTGASSVLRILEEELRHAMVLAGVASVHDIPPDLLVSLSL